MTDKPQMTNKQQPDSEQIFFGFDTVKPLTFLQKIRMFFRRGKVLTDDMSYCVAKHMDGKIYIVDCGELKYGWKKGQDVSDMTDGEYVRAFKHEGVIYGGVKEIRDCNNRLEQIAKRLDKIDKQEMNDETNLR